MNKKLLTLAGAALALTLAACADPAATPSPATGAIAQEGQPAAPADAFLTALASECGKAFAGRIVANEPATGQPDELPQPQPQG